MPASMIAGAAAPIAGGIIGNIAAGGDQDQATADMQAALQAYQNINVPTVAEQEWNLEQEKQQGALSPEALQTMEMGPNALQGIQTNPAYTAAQTQALQQLGQLGQGGLTAQEKQNLINANLAASGQAKSQNASVLQNMAARGMAGSGAELASELANGQNAANMQAQQSNSINSMAQQNALQAVAQQGSLAGQLQQAQFGQQAAIAQAQNAINQFNAQNAQNVAGYNTQVANQAQAQNLANQQNIANTNVGLANQQQAHNTGLYQQQFQDQMSRAQGMAGADIANANYMNNQANATRGMWSGIGSGVGSAANAYGLSNAMSGWGSPSSSNSSSSGNYMPSSQDWANYTSAPSSQYGGNYIGGTASNPVWSFKGGMINPPDYNEGGEVHDNKNLEELKKAFSKFITEEEKESYADGGSVINEVNSGLDESHPQAVWTEEEDKPKKEDDSKARKPAKDYAKGGEVKPHKGPAQEPKGEVAKPKNPPSMSPFMGIPSYSMGGDVIGLSGHAGNIPLPNSHQVHKMGYADGGNVATNSNQIVPGVGRMSDINAFTAGMAGQKAPTPIMKSGMRYPSPVNAEQAAQIGEDMTAQEHGQVPLTQADYDKAMINAMAAAKASKVAPPVMNSPTPPKEVYSAIVPGMYEGGNLQGLPTAPQKKVGSTDQAQSYSMGGPIPAYGVNMFNTGGNVHARVSPQEIYYTPNEAKAVAEHQVTPKQVGRVVPGKAPVKGDSPKNDIIDAKLQKGGIVVPRSIAKKSDDEILDFVKKAREGKR